MADQLHVKQWRIRTKAKILLAEDNPGDVFLVRRALGLHGVDAELTVIADGQAALGFIESADAGEVSWRPELMLLDLNLPRATGARILERLRQSRGFSGVPVIIVTSSNSLADRDQVLHLGATQYFHKPIDLAGFMALGGIVRTLLQDSGTAVSG